MAFSHGRFYDDIVLEVRFDETSYLSISSIFLTFQSALQNSTRQDTIVLDGYSGLMVIVKGSELFEIIHNLEMLTNLILEKGRIHSFFKIKKEN